MQHFLLRWLHAWAWVAFWVWAVGKASHAYPVNFANALGMGAILTPGVYLPWVLARRENEPELSGMLSAPLATALAGGFVSYLVLGSSSLLGYWDRRPRGATMGGVLAAVVVLHLVAAVCIALAEPRLLPEGDDD